MLRIDDTTVKSLRAHAKEQGYKIPGMAKMVKAELWTAIAQIEEDADNAATLANFVPTGDFPEGEATEAEMTAYIKETLDKLNAAPAIDPVRTMLDKLIDDYHADKAPPDAPLPPRDERVASAEQIRETMKANLSDADYQVWLSNSVEVMRGMVASTEPVGIDIFNVLSGPTAGSDNNLTVAQENMITAIGKAHDATVAFVADYIGTSADTATLDALIKKDLVTIGAIVAKMATVRLTEKGLATYARLTQYSRAPAIVAESPGPRGERPSDFEPRQTVKWVTLPCKVHCWAKCLRCENVISALGRRNEGTMTIDQRKLEAARIPDALIRALVYQDQMGRCWYAYGPQADNGLDAGGAIDHIECETREEAYAHVRECLIKAIERPWDTAYKMAE